MINSVELGNFLSHSETKINFEQGVTVFVGHNGAGKSSIIDAITFALFGQHSRKSNKGLIRRGQNQAFSEVNFSINGKEYQAVRKINTKGTLVSQFSEKKNGEWAPIAEGERKQFGESMTNKIEASIGLDFEKLKIASIVRQGELNSIITAKPKEFKELINAVIGIDKLDIASEHMKNLIKDFRESIENKLGYNDIHIDILKNELEESKKEIDENTPLRESLQSKKITLQKDVIKLKREIEIESPKVDKINQLKIRKNELLRYAKEAILTIQKEINEKEKKVNDCENCFEFLDNKTDIEKNLKIVENTVEDTSTKIEKNKMNIVSLKEQQLLAKRLQLQNGKCPVCDTQVDHLNPLFQEKHLEDEIKKLKSDISSLEKENDLYNKKKKEFTEKLQYIKEAEATLRAHSIRDVKEINKIKQEIKIKKTTIQKIPLTINVNRFLEIATIDSHAKLLYEKIQELESETSNFDFNSFEKLKNSLDSKQNEISEIDQKLGGITEKIRRGQENIKKIDSVLEELFVVREYITDLEEIQGKIFNRDGPVAISLRSWALNTISMKASEYLSMLNTKIQRIELTEKARDVSIRCYTKKTTLELESLSGGEQVSIALALRLGMAQLLGTSNLNFVILDEPTTHLDEERRKSLVRVLSQLSDISNSPHSTMQFIIITHDSEIFEDSAVEQIYKFESSESGTIVTKI